jgi:chemotaxis protein histidine kinase CheA
MTASPPKANGSTRPRTVQFADWRITAASEEQRAPQPVPAPAEKPDLVAAAEAATIRARGEAEAEAIRIAAEAAAQAEIVKAEEEARKQRIANDRAERKGAEEHAASQARIAEHNRRRDEADRARVEAQEAAQDEKATEQKTAQEIADADDKWRAYAIRFAIVCGIVSLPVQMSFFWNPHAPWMAAAPIMLEGAAWVVHRGARAAAVSKRPVWHYRTIVWFLAFIAAAINLYHGLHSFDPGTALATAFASIAGPGVWDLHEHGRIRKRDGALTRRERKAQRKAERAEAARKAAEEKRLAAEKEAADEAAEAARKELRETRQTVFKDVWEEAVKIGAALGKAPDDPAVWPRAYRNIKGCDPGESIESISSRRTAEKRVEAALTGTPVNTLSKTTSAQRAVQTPRSSYKPVPPRRTPGDTPRYSRAAGRAHGDLLRRKNARQKDQ